MLMFLFVKSTLRGRYRFANVGIRCVTGIIIPFPNVALCCAATAPQAVDAVCTFAIDPATFGVSLEKTGL